ncbi:hypothetical protein [Thiohalorhabdus denitrificans]|uniref:Uncharacterized protein n=1 Tax=Thiohalorhabdus denitrificans TaxID=381306 RepID=A0A1G5AYH8_9GAMM|nr:hypothetical protein [Thiohalorhabdus denitrificans]SCX82880.1 hypothetical protein SAMN05661077_0594 [Thiohalorhabdus denitrificans]
MWSFLLPGPLARSESLRAFAVAGFSAFFLFAAVAMGGMAFFEMARGVYGLLAAAMHGGESVTAFIQGLNTAVIAMAAYDRAASWRSPLAPPAQK